MPAGTMLAEKHLRALKLWGVAVVRIEDAGKSGNAAGEPTSSTRTLIQARAFTTRLYCHNQKNSEHPVYKHLFSHSMTRVARLIDSGYLTEDLLSYSPAPANKAPLPVVSQSAIGSLEDLVIRTETIASLPEIYSQIVEVVNHPHSSSRDVANLISGDTGLTARLLRLVNSAFYGFPSRIETVSRATTLIGTNELCELALATSVMSIFGKALEGIVDMNMFWSHSLACGIVARILANSASEPNSERYFVAALLHDVGKLMILKHMPDVARQILEAAKDTGRPVHSIESEILRYNHTDAGGALLGTWGLAPSHREAVSFHHNPLTARNYPVEAAITHVAEVISNAMRTGREHSDPLPSLEIDAWESLELDPETLPAILDEAEVQIRDLQSAFEMGH
ncbi:HDOD domain-containing protein [Candidatus Hydrogenedentota bacterium]